MTCQRITQYLDDFVDGELDRTLHEELETHAEGCAECRAILNNELSFRRVLSEIPVASATPGFYDRVFNTVAARAEHVDNRSRSRWLPLSAGGAVAAVLTVWLMAGTIFQDPEIERLEEIPGLTIALDETRTVSLVFDSNEALADATLIVRLPSAVEIDGYDGREEIRWSTNIVRGKNVLALPIVARELGSGKLVARVEHDGKHKTFTVKVSVI